MGVDIWTMWLALTFVLLLGFCLLIMGLSWWQTRRWNQYLNKNAFKACKPQEER
jgi:CHASE3 domain sensor protein